MNKNQAAMDRRTLFKILGGIGGATVVSAGLAACSSTATTSVSSTSSASSSARASASSSSSTSDVGAGNPDLFDGNAHEVTLDIATADMQTMLTAYQQDKSKSWVSATITIDGKKIENIGVRLKGNSTVKSLQNVSIDSSGKVTSSSNSTSGGPGGGMGGAPGGMGGDSAIDATDITTWPFLISFDKNTDKQIYQGYSRMGIRPGIPVLNEAVALGMTAATGQASQKYAYIKYTLNGQKTTTRLMIVVPDKYYAKALGDGILYKVDSSSSFSYQGDTESTYTDQFEQINGDDTQAPIINLLKWLSNVSDSDFDSQLGQYVDVESFARYVATQNLLVNTDDVSGPGKNGYLWYNNSTKLFTIISWDLDMSMSGSTSAGPDDSTSMGGGGMGGGGGKGGGSSNGNALKTKFLASSTMQTTYHKVYWELYDKIYGNNAAQTLLDKLAKIVPVTDGLTQDTLNSNVKTLTNWISQRTSALSSVRSKTDTSS